MKRKSAQLLLATILPLLYAGGCGIARNRPAKSAKLDEAVSLDIADRSEPEKDIQETTPAVVQVSTFNFAATETNGHLEDKSRTPNPLAAADLSFLMLGDATGLLSQPVPSDERADSQGFSEEPPVVVQVAAFHAGSNDANRASDNASHKRVNTGLLAKIRSKLHKPNVGASDRSQSILGDAPDVVDRILGSNGRSDTQERHLDTHEYARSAEVAVQTPEFGVASAEASSASEFVSNAEPLSALTSEVETSIATELDHCQSILSQEADVGKTESRSSQVTQVDCHLLCEKPLLQRECMNLGLGNITAVRDSCGLKYLAPYLDRVDGYDESLDHSAIAKVTAVPACPLSAWWEQDVLNPSRPKATGIRLDIESLLIRTLANSKYLQGLADLPLIREKSTMEAAAEFDVTRFMESRFRRPSDPVGNDLTVGPGGSRRFRENDFATAAGIARKTSTGARVELAQEIGLLTNNSEFLNPRHQGNARLTLNLTQPLMSGRGKAYNTSLIMLAQMDERVAWDQVSQQLQEYLVEVTENYWQLYLERSRLTQKRRHLQRAEAILAELVPRRDFDAVESQIARARSAVQSRRSELIRAEATVRNVESRLRGLVNDPELYGSAIELVPGEIPQCQRLEISARDAMSQALEARSEIDEAIQKVRAAGVRLRVAKNELMPILDVVLETYLSGLRGSNDIGRAWVDQFSVGEPGYTVGLRYEIPINNRLAKNRHDRRRIEMRQAISQFQFQVEELMSDVEIAVRNVHAAHAEMLSRYEAMTASEIDLAYFQKRWELLPSEGNTATFLLDNILEAQDRLAAEESNFAQTQVSYTMAILDLKRELGILLQSEKVETRRVCNSGLDQLLFHKTESLNASDEQPKSGPMLESATIEQRSGEPTLLEPALIELPSPPAKQMSGQRSKDYGLDVAPNTPPVVVEEFQPTGIDNDR